MEQAEAADDLENFQTPPKAQATFRRRNRDNVLSPGSLRARKLSKLKDELMYEKVQMMIQSDISCTREEMLKEMYKTVENAKKEMYAYMRIEFEKEMSKQREEMQTDLKGAMQAIVRAEVLVVETLMQKRLEDTISQFETWKSDMTECMNAKNAVIEELQGELATLKSKGACTEEREIQPAVVRELETIKEQVKNLRDGEEEKSRVVSSYAEALSKTQQKADEAEKWIEIEKKGKADKKEATSTSTIINMTIEEEQKRRTRAFHVRITGLKDNGNVEEEVKGLLDRMGISEVTHSGAWRVGKKGTDARGNPKEKALIVRFPTMDARKEFLKKRSTLKNTGIFLGDDLTLAQVAHLQEVMPEIKAAREKGKTAFYREGKVVILEKHTK